MYIGTYNNKPYKLLSIFFIFLCLTILLLSNKASAITGDATNVIPNNGTNNPWMVVTRPGSNGMDAPQSTVNIYIPNAISVFNVNIRDACDSTTNDESGGNNTTTFGINENVADVANLSSNSSTANFISTHFIFCNSGSDTSFDLIRDSGAPTEVINNQTYWRVNLVAAIVNGSSSNYYANRFKIDSSTAGVYFTFSSSPANPGNNSAGYTGIAYSNGASNAWGWETTLGFATPCSVDATNAQVYFFDSDHQDINGIPSSPFWQSNTRRMTYTIKAYNRSTDAYIGVVNSNKSGGPMQDYWLNGGQNTPDPTDKFNMNKDYKYTVTVSGINYINSIQISLPYPQVNTLDNCLPPAVPGCTDPAAANYNPSATINNGSCVYPVPGCTDPDAINYNPAATVNNGTCVYNYAPTGSFTITCDSAAVLTVTANVSDTEGGTLTATANVNGGASPASRTGTRTNSGAITFATFKGAYNTAHTVTGTVSDPGGLSATITQASVTCSRPEAVYTCTATTSATTIYEGASFELYITIDNISSQYALPMTSDTHPIVASAPEDISNFGPNSDPNNIYVYPKDGLKYDDKDLVITDDDLISTKEGSYKITITVGVIDCSKTVQIVQPPPILSCNSGASFSETEFNAPGTLSTIVVNETSQYGPDDLEITSRVYTAVGLPEISIDAGSSTISAPGDIIKRNETRTITQGATMPTKGTYNFKLTVKYEATMDDKKIKGGEVQCNGSQVASSKPYLKVYGGDVWAGAKWPDGTDCNVSDKGIYAFTKRQSDGTFNGSGSSAQLTVTSLLSIGQFYSASQRPASPTPPNGLAFANTSTDGEYGGNYAKGASISRCMPDYESTKDVNKIVDIKGTPNYQTYFDGLTRGSGSTYQFTVDGNFASSVTSWPQGLQAALYVSGDVYIGNNIEYAAANSDDVNQIPRLQLIVNGGNIYIGKDVTRIDGLFVAQPSGSTGGKIYTCAKSTGTYTAAELVTEGCDKQQLAINGQFVADKVRFLRTIGTVRDSTATETPVFANGSGTSAAEVFNFSPLDYLAPSALQDPWSTGGSVKPYQSVVSLPPIY